MEELLKKQRSLVISSLASDNTPEINAAITPEANMVFQLIINHLYGNYILLCDIIQQKIYVILKYYK